MIRYQYKSLLTTILAFLSLILNAQSGKKDGIGEMSGKVIDSLSKQPLEYVTISLTNLENNKIVDGTSTQSNGEFKLAGIEEGEYKLQFYFIGYKPLVKKNLVISKSNPTIAFGNVEFVNQQTQLKEVTVSAEKSVIENRIDKMVYNAEKDITSQGGVATDILKKVPQVTVNSDGSVELQGNPNVRFLIDGKPSTVFGNNITDVLQTIPASQIQSIEVITSPGAKYDAEGTGGIINIILKKVTSQGVYGNLSLTGGSRLENGSFNLGARKGKFGINAFAAGNMQILTTTINKMNRESTSPVTSLSQNGTSDFTRQGFESGLSFDWSPSGKNNFNGGVSYDNFGNSNKSSTNRQTITSDSAGNQISNIAALVLANNKSNEQAFDWNLNYKRKFNKEDQELDILYSASLSQNYTYYLQTQQYQNNDYVYNGSYGKNPGTEVQHNISLNYTHPVSEKLLFETGGKTVLYQINTKTDAFLLDPLSNEYNFNNSQSNAVNYHRNVYAGYVSTTIKTKILDIKAGVRDEYTQTNASFANYGKADINPYNTIVPSGVISHRFKKNHTVKISYSYRIQRPGYNSLNPFINASDPKNLTTGNPALKPETAHNIEIGYSTFFEKGINLNVNAFYRGNRADIQTYQRYYDSFQVGDSTYHNVTVSTRENIGREDNFGLNIFASIAIKKKINLRSNISAFQRYIYSSIDPGSNISGFNYRLNINGSYQISETLIIEVFGNFNSPRINIQGTMPAFKTYNFALRKQFYHKKMSIAFTTTNPFNKYVNLKTNTTGTNFYLTNLSQMPYRSFGLNFSWKFGRLEFKKQQEDYNLTNPPMQGN